MRQSFLDYTVMFSVNLTPVTSTPMFPLPLNPPEGKNTSESEIRVRNIASRISVA